MGLFDFFKKKEVVVNNPIVETKNDDPIKKGDISIEGNKEQIIIKVENPEKKIVTSNEAALESMGFSSIFLIKGLRDDVASSEIVDFIEHDEISEEAKKLTIDYVTSLKGKVFYSHKKFNKLQDSPYKCKDKAKTQVWLYNLIDFELLTIGTKYDGKELIELTCKEMPELNTKDKEKLIVIANELKSN